MTVTGMPRCPRRCWRSWWSRIVSACSWTASMVSSTGSARCRSRSARGGGGCGSWVFSWGSGGLGWSAGGLVLDESRLLLGAVDLGDAEVDHGGGDGAQEEQGGPQGAEAESALVAGSGEEFAYVGTQRAGQYVGQPEGQDRTHEAGSPSEEDGGDETRREQDRGAGAPTGELEGPVADGGAQSEGHEHDQPVPGLALGRVDRVDRQRALTGVPEAEDDGEE